MKSLQFKTPQFQIIQDSESKGVMFAQLLSFGKFQHVFEQGDHADKLYMVKSGLVKIFHQSEKGEQFIQEIKSEGELFGEWQSIFDPSSKHRNFAKTITENTEVLVLNLVEVDLNRAPFLLDLFKRMSKENENWQVRFQRLLHRNAEYRIKETLIELALKAGKKFGDETLLKAYLSHEDIGQLADCSRQTVTTLMNNLKKSKKITYRRDRILFRNLSLIHN